MRRRVRRGPAPNRVCYAGRRLGEEKAVCDKFVTRSRKRCLSFGGCMQKSRVNTGEIVGGPGRDRTDDLFHAMEARSQLRHRPTRRMVHELRLHYFLVGVRASQTRVETPMQATEACISHPVTFISRSPRDYRVRACSRKGSGGSRSGSSNPASSGIPR